MPLFLPRFQRQIALRIEEQPLFPIKAPLETVLPREGSLSIAPDHLQHRELLCVMEHNGLAKVGVVILRVHLTKAGWLALFCEIQVAHSWQKYLSTGRK